MEKNNSFLLRVNDLSISYGNIVAIREINLKVEKGEIVTLIGANGAGKSTLVKGILGIQRPSRGSISFLGQDITWTTVDRIVASGIVLVPEGRGIVMEMTVMENLQLGAYQFRGNIEERLNQVYELFPVLKKRSKQFSGTLSGGEQQMLSIGRGLMSKPVLMMLDEPSLGLAPVTIKELFKIFPKLVELGHTILLSEQNVRMAFSVAHRGYVFETGEVVATGTSEELKTNKRVQQSYLGMEI